MSEVFQVQRWRPGPLLPPRDARDGSLVFVVAVLCFLACLTALVALAANRAAEGWTNQLTGSATVVVRARPNETPDSAAARAVVDRPDVLLADEPTGNVDPAMSLRLLRLFVELNRLATTVLIATHDEDVVARANRPTLHLEKGRLIDFGDPEEGYDQDYDEGEA